MSALSNATSQLLLRLLLLLLLLPHIVGSLPAGWMTCFLQYISSVWVLKVGVHSFSGALELTGSRDLRRLSYDYENKMWD